MPITSNVGYNYQKNPNLNTSNKEQSKIGLTIALRDRVNYNRNVTSIFPVNLSSPNFGAGSPTILAVQEPSKIGIYPYAGAQISGLGEVT